MFIFISEILFIAMGLAVIAFRLQQLDSQAQRTTLRRESRLAAVRVELARQPMKQAPDTDFVWALHPVLSNR